MGTITPVFSETVEAGKVVDQYPAPDTEVEEGEKVNLTVSQGPDPNVQEKDVTVTVYIPLPSTGEIVNLVVMMDGAIVLEANYDTAMDTFA